jgi:hypothetical protein
MRTNFSDDYDRMSGDHADIQHKSSHHLSTSDAFGWEGDDRVPVVWPDEDGEPVQKVEHAWCDVLALLHFATTSKEEIADRALFLGYMAGTEGAPKTLRELGARLGISHVAAGKRLTALKRVLQGIRPKQPKNTPRRLTSRALVEGQRQ